MQNTIPLAYVCAYYTHIYIRSEKLTKIENVNKYFRKKRFWKSRFSGSEESVFREVHGIQERSKWAIVFVFRVFYVISATILISSRGVPSARTSIVASSRTCFAATVPSSTWHKQAAGARDGGARPGGDQRMGGPRESGDQ